MDFIGKLVELEGCNWDLEGVCVSIDFNPTQLGVKGSGEYHALILMNDGSFENVKITDNATTMRIVGEDSRPC